MRTPQLTRALPIFWLLACYTPQGIGAVVNATFNTTPVSFNVTPNLPYPLTVVATATLDTDVTTVNYDVSLNDSTGGTLDNGGNKLAYSVSFAGQPTITLTAVPQSVETGVSQLVAAQRTIAVTISGMASVGLPAGQYTTTITLTLTGN